MHYTAVRSEKWGRAYLFSLLLSEHVEDISSFLPLGCSSLLKACCSSIASALWRLSVAGCSGRSGIAVK